MWLTEPEIREKMLLIEKGGCAHTRMAASVTLASTVGVLQTIIDDYTEARAHARQLRAQHEHLASAASRHDPLPPSHLNQSADRAFLPGEAILGDTSLQAQRLELRRAEGARRACHHLYRLSRIVPVDDSILAVLGRSALHATGCLSASANDSNATLSNRTAKVSERMSSSDSSLSSPTLHASGGAGALRDLPLVAGLKPDANSPVPSKSASDFDALADLPLASSLNDDANSSPLRRTVRCHGFQPVESGHPNTSSSSSPPPPGRTMRLIDEENDPRVSDTPAHVPRPPHEA